MINYKMIYTGVIFIIIFLIFSCNVPQTEIKYDSKGRVISYHLSKTDTVYFAEASAEIDTNYYEQLMNLSTYIKSSKNEKLLLTGYCHEDENPKIREERNNSLINYLSGIGVDRSRLYSKVHPPMLSRSEDGLLTDNERLIYRRVIIQIVE